MHDVGPGAQVVEEVTSAVSRDDRRQRRIHTRHGKGVVKLQRHAIDPFAIGCLAVIVDVEEHNVADGHLAEEAKVDGQVHIHIIDAVIVSTAQAGFTLCSRWLAVVHQRHHVGADAVDLRRGIVDAVLPGVIITCGRHVQSRNAIQAEQTTHQAVVLELRRRDEDEIGARGQEREAIASAIRRHHFAQWHARGGLAFGEELHLHAIETFVSISHIVVVQVLEHQVADALLARYREAQVHRHIATGIAQHVIHVTATAQLRAGGAVACGLSFNRQLDQRCAHLGLRAQRLQAVVIIVHLVVAARVHPAAGRGAGQRPARGEVGHRHHHLVAPRCLTVEDVVAVAVRERPGQAQLRAVGRAAVHIAPQLHAHAGDAWLAAVRRAVVVLVVPDQVANGSDGRHLHGVETKDHILRPRPDFIHRPRRRRHGHLMHADHACGLGGGIDLDQRRRALHTALHRLQPLVRGHIQVVVHRVVFDLPRVKCPLSRAVQIRHQQRRGRQRRIRQADLEDFRIGLVHCVESFSLDVDAGDLGHR